MDALFEQNYRCKLTPRDYQQEAHDEAFRQFDSGATGVMIRLATGLGKTPTACMIMQTWLNRGPEYRAMVVSYEKQLVWQFAQEIEDFLGITPGIEMEKEAVHPDRIPPITVACRASLLRATPPTQEQLDEMESFGIQDVGGCPQRECQKILRYLRKGIDVDSVRSEIQEYNARREVADGFHSRIHKFDPTYNWLVIFDEAHRHVKKLASVGHLVEWFERNEKSKRLGLTATPKRSDNVSGAGMFPKIAIDYPLFSIFKKCAVKDGWAVPYLQKYIEVEGLDFKSLNKLIKGNKKDFDEADLEKMLLEEGRLSKLVQPMLDMVGDRRTLIFSPGVEMAKQVALYINARVEAICPECAKQRWYPRKLIGDGAQCPCGHFIESQEVSKKDEQCVTVWGEVAPKERREIYKGHQTGKYQFLSVCGLCREGYNDREIACVTCFRPVSKKAASLAEQMKGRGCRPLKGLVDGKEGQTKEERLEAISSSAKPNCLIIDLVGITGLADCASTVSIYAEGVPDEVEERANAILAEKAVDEETDVEGAIEEAQKQLREEKEKAKAEREAAFAEQQRIKREEAETRARAGAEVKYTTHDVGYGTQVDTNAASEGQLKFIAALGMKLRNIALTKKQAGRMINMLKLRTDLKEVARLNGIGEDQWSFGGPSIGQLKMMAWKRIPHDNGITGYDATQLITARLNPEEFKEKKMAEIAKAKTDEELTGIGKDMKLVRGVLSESVFNLLVSIGKEKRSSFHGDAWEG